jgi:hypothetical protein
MSNCNVLYINCFGALIARQCGCNGQYFSQCFTIIKGIIQNDIKTCMKNSEKGVWSVALKMMIIV